MATTLWDQEITKHVDWAGDESTGRNPVSGKYVQKFIKDTLESKMGCLEYDRANNRYMVFADEENKELYLSNPTEYASLLLGQFSAPAPAFLNIITGDPYNTVQTGTFLVGTASIPVDFGYHIESSSGGSLQEAVTMRVSMNRSGETQSFVRTLPVDFDHYQDKDAGTPVSLDLSDYLTVDGTYEITITLTTQQTNVSSFLNLRYRIVDLQFNSGFDNTKAIDYASSQFNIPFTVNGAAGTSKLLQLYIDGVPYYQDKLGYGTLALSHGSDIGSSNNINNNITLYRTANGSEDPVRWPELGEAWGDGTFTNATLAGQEVFTPGKHTLQVSCYIIIQETGMPVYSKTKYFDFIIGYPSSDTRRHTFIMYKADLDAGQVFDPSQTITFTSKQYESTSFMVSVYDSAGRTVPVLYKMTDEATGDKVDEMTHSVKSGETDTFNYNFMTSGRINLDIYETLSGPVTETSTPQLSVLLVVTPSTANVGEYTDNLFVKYSALNRSNQESDHSWVNISEFGNIEKYKFPATFNRVLWNDQSGWSKDGKSLILKNGATVTFPFNLFENQGDNQIFSNSGMTFEIEFETSDIQRDDAEIMNFSDPTNKSYIKITATEAKICTQNSVSLNTNFKDNEKIKIAFVFNPIAAVNDAGKYTGTDFENPNLLFIIVNGVLDRVCRWGNGKSTTSDSFTWRNPQGDNKLSFTIGNTKGEVTTKLYSIRVYRTALTPENAYKNYEYDGGEDLINRYNRNKIVEDNQISLDAVREVIPTLLLSGDYEAVNTAKKKKENIMANLQFWDPTDPSRNFFCRDAYVSCQGTSSMNYPIKNLRPYFCKKPSTKEGEATFDRFQTGNHGASRNDMNVATPQMSTEFWPVSEYLGHEDEVDTWVDANRLPFGTNKKVDDEGKYPGYHKIGANCTPAYRQQLAEQWAAVDGGKDIYGNTEYIYKFDGTTMTIVDPATDPISTNGTGDTNYYYISEYRPARLHDNTENDGIQSDDNYWKRLKELRYAGVKLYTRTDTVDEEGNITVTYKEAKKKKDKLSVSKQYYVLGSWWKQYEKSGFTDRWTVKADYAESSMCHNSGTGRLWGQAMKNVTVGGNYVCQTNAQQAASKYEDFFDVRTSCDGKPIVIFVREIDNIDETTGKYNYKPAKFAGLFNIMTDKSSTKLFGFEDLYDENAVKVFDASKTQCWECLANGSLIVQGLTPIMDVLGESETTGADLGDGRTIWKDLESRWPDTGQERHEGNDAWPDDTYGVESNAAESFYNWLHFCQPAINYIVDPKQNNGQGIDGYTLNPYVEITDLDEVRQYYADYCDGLREHDDDKVAENRLYVQWNNSGNIAYATFGEAYKDDAGNDVEGGLQGATSADDVDANLELDVYQLPNGKNFWKLITNINYEDVQKTVNTETIGQYYQRTMNISTNIYLGHVKSFDSTYRCLDEEGKIDDNEANKYLVDVYMWSKNNKYYYYDNYGNEVQYTENVDRDDYLKINGRSIAQMTFMEYFSATKEEHLDLWKVAAYYVYVIRAGAVDQVVKNTMMTTEDGHSWYFINYDNDTILGVRNDGLLKFNWDFNRDTYDVSGSAYSFAGAKSVLWNTLEQDADFLSYVKQVDNAMSSSDLFSVKAVLEMYNEKQEGTWCERLYNEQEQIKYLSTFKNDFNTDKYLGFMHGTRHSHRTWWVNKRWELYDAMWNSGKYAQKQMKFYVDCAGASINNPIPIVRVIPSSKYYFTLFSNTQSIGFVEIDPNDIDESKRSYTFKALQPYSLGDPMRLLGPDKIKILDFRETTGKLSSNTSFAEAEVLITNEDGSSEQITWVQDSGTTMTRVLIGNGVDTCKMGTMSGLNSLTSLEEVDLRKLSQIAAVDISNLINLHRYRISGSVVNSFEPAEGTTFYEADLSNQIAKITLNKVTFMGAESDYLVDNNHPEWTPVYDETVHTYTPEAIFNYTINENLSDVTLIEVSGFDTQKFVTDWYNYLTANSLDTTACTLHIEGVEWNNITVQTLIDIYNNFDVKKFTGLFNVVSDDPEVQGITREEYDALINTFTAEAFKPGATTQINVSTGMFFDPTSSAFRAIEDPSGTTTNNPDVLYYYDVVRGTEFEVNATIFPVSNDLKYEYQLALWNTSRNRYETSSASGEYPTKQFRDNVNKVTLENIDNKAIVLGDEDNSVLTEPIYQISVIGLKEDNSVDTTKRYSEINRKFIYVHMLKQIIPIKEEINIQNTNGDTVEAINDGNEHEYTINFGSRHNTFNLQVTDIKVSLSNASNKTSDDFTRISNITVDNENKEFKFNMSSAIKDTTYRLPLYFTITFNTANVDNRTMTFSREITVNTIYAQTATIYEYGTDNVISQSTEQFLNKTGDVFYQIRFTPENYNVPISAITTSDYASRLDLTTDTEDVTKLKLTISNNVVNNKYQSFTTNCDYNLSIVPSMGAETHTLDATLKVRAAIVYPERVFVSSESTTTALVPAEQESKLVVLNGQGYTSANPVKVNLDVRPSTMVPEGTEITEDYTISITNVAISAVGKEDELDPVSNITATVMNDATKHGNYGIELTVAAVNNFTSQFLMTFDYAITFDQDDTNQDAEDTVTLSGTVRYKIYRSLADANRYIDLTEGEWYAVDYLGNFYKLTNSGSWNQTNSLMLDDTISGNNILGIGTVKSTSAGKTPLFMSFSKTNATKMLNDSGTTITRIASIMEGKMTASQVSQSNLWDGYKVTSLIAEDIKDLVNERETIIYKVYHLFDANSTLKGYVPSYNEIAALSESDYDKFNALCAQLVGNNKISAYDEMVFVVNSADVNYFTSSIQSYGSTEYGIMNGVVWTIVQWINEPLAPSASFAFSHSANISHRPFIKVD